MGFKDQISEMADEESDTDKKSDQAQDVKQPEPVDTSKPMP